jgi:hypothetical protein
VEAVDPPWDPRRLLRWLRLMEPVGYKRPEKNRKNKNLIK